MKYIIDGGNRLEGTIVASGNKNSIFPCVAAALLTNKPVTLHNVPAIQDTYVLLDILQSLGVATEYVDSTLRVEATTVKSDVPRDLMTKLRGSIVLVGALLARNNHVTFYHPGGDIIGKRSIETHLEGFALLGARVEQNDLRYSAQFSSLPETKEISIFLSERSVTGTENLILAATKRKGRTILKNCAEEPHVVDLCLMLVSMGGSITGIGTSMITVEGCVDLGGTEFTLGTDYIEVGTYAIAAAITKGKIVITNMHNIDLDPIIIALQKFGIQATRNESAVTFMAGDLHAANRLVTNIWPGFPTDLMSATIVLATQSQGATLCHDWMYESRMFFVDKLINMGAHITIADPHRVLIYGPTQLKGRELDSPDIRAGMALVLAALVADGRSSIDRVEIIERGYEKVIEKLKNLGAKIEVEG